MSEILTKYKNISVQAKASMWYSVTQIFQKGIGFIIVPLYTRILSTHDYGTYTIFTSWYEIMVIFGTLRIYDNSFNVGLTKFENDRDRYTSSMLGFGGVCTIFFFTIACFFYNQFEKWLEMSFPLIALLFLEILWNPALNLWMQRQRYSFKYKALNAVVLISTAITPIIGFILVLLLPNHALGAILGKCLPQIFAGILCAWLILKKSRTLFDKKYWGYVLRFNVPLIFYYLARVLLNQMDRIMIQKMQTVSQVGIYSVAHSASFTLNIISTSINASFIPYMFQKMKAHEEGKIRSLANTLAIVVALCNMCLIVLAPEAMKLMAPPEYHDGIWLIPPLVASVVVTFVYQMYCNVEFYYEKKFFLMWASVGVCICNGILNYIFIGLFGYIAAGYTTLASNIFCLIAHYFCVKKILHTNHVKKVLNNRFMCLLCIGFSVFSGIMMLTYEHMVIRYSVLAVILLVVIYKRKEILQKLKFKHD